MGFFYCQHFKKYRQKSNVCALTGEFCRVAVIKKPLNIFETASL
jgi:hypothetical protein